MNFENRYTTVAIIKFSIEYPYKMRISQISKGKQIVKTLYPLESTMTLIGNSMYKSSAPDGIYKMISIQLSINTEIRRCSMAVNETKIKPNTLQISCIRGVFYWIDHHQERSMSNILRQKMYKNETNVELYDQYGLENTSYLRE